MSQPELLFHINFHLGEPLVGFKAYPDTLQKPFLDQKVPKNSVFRQKKQFLQTFVQEKEHKGL